MSKSHTHKRYEDVYSILLTLSLIQIFNARLSLGVLIVNRVMAGNRYQCVYVCMYVCMCVCIYVFACMIVCECIVLPLCGVIIFLFVSFAY